MIDMKRRAVDNGKYAIAALSNRRVSVQQVGYDTPKPTRFALSRLSPSSVVHMFIF